MPRVNVYIRNEDWEAWQNIVDKPKWIHEGLQTGLVTIPPRNIPTPKQAELKNFPGIPDGTKVNLARDVYMNYVTCKHGSTKGFCKKGCK